MSFLRALALATRGIGPVALGRLEEIARGHACPLAEVVLSRGYEGALSAGQTKSLDAFGKF